MVIIGFGIQCLSDNKGKLIDQMAKDAGIFKVAAGASLNFFIDEITKTLKKKDSKVTLVAFGTFQNT